MYCISWAFCMHTLFCIVNTLVSVVFIKEVFIFLTFSLRIRTHWLVFEADCDVLHKYLMSCYCIPCLLLNVWKSSPELLVYFVMFSWKCFVKPCWVMLQSGLLHTHKMKLNRFLFKKQFWHSLGRHCTGGETSERIAGRWREMRKRDSKSFHQLMAAITLV